MRAIWKGAVAFGLVNVPVKLYSATGQHEVPLHQVHREDAGRVRYRRVCSVCGSELSMADIDKGYETADGSVVVLSDADLAELPLATEREIEVLEFVPGEQVDPILMDRTYYLEPEKTAVKAYTLLRQALEQADRMAVVKVALRQRESMAVLRVRDDVIVMQTLLWPDEIRAADFPVLEADVQVRPQELAMASSLVESMAADFDPSAFEDRYVTALERMIEEKVSAGTTVTPTAEAETTAPAAAGGEVVDLLAALQRSVESARAGRAPGAAGPAAAAGEPAGEEPAGAEPGGSAGTTEATKPAGTKPAGTKAATKPAGTKQAATKPAGTKAGGTSAGGTKAGGTRAAGRKPAAATQVEEEPAEAKKSDDEAAPKKAAARRRAS